jgi:RimJ/RimL family protein N-acetyltransferase
MTAAFAAFLTYVWDTFDVERLQAEVFAWNPGSARVLEKNGFRLEGTRRRAIFKDGELIDESMYTLFRSQIEPQ